MKSSVPKQYISLPEKDKKVICEYIRSQITEGIDRDCVELQKVWIKLACIVLRRAFWMNKEQIEVFLYNWKQVYEQNSGISTKKEQDEFINSALGEVFDGDYPEKFIESLEDIGDDGSKKFSSKVPPV